MLRSMFNGSVNFGLVSVPVKVFSATEDHDPELHQVHVEDGARIRYLRRCEACGPDIEIPYADVGKGYTTEKGEVVILTPELLAEIHAHAAQEITVTEFIPADQVDPLLIDKSYFLGPGKAASKSYAVLRAAMEQSGMVAVAKVTLRSRESLAILRVLRDTLVMQTLLWPDEIRLTTEVPDLSSVAGVKDDEEALTLARMVIDAMSADFDPTRYTDEHAALLRGLVAKLEASGHAKPVPVITPSEQNGAALLAQLEASIGAATKSGG